MKQEECMYCGAWIDAILVENVPPADDNEEWERLANQHHVWCEWIATRAHRVGMDA